MVSRRRVQGPTGVNASGAQQSPRRRMLPEVTAQEVRAAPGDSDSKETAFTPASICAMTLPLHRGSKQLGDVPFGKPVQQRGSNEQAEYFGRGFRAVHRCIASGASGRGRGTGDLLSGTE